MCLSSSKVWARQLWRWRSNDRKPFKMANGGEGFPRRKDTFSSPPPPWGFLMSDVKCTAVINKTPTAVTGGWERGQEWDGDSISPGPHRGSFQLGFQRAVPRKAGGEAGVNHWAGRFWVKAEERGDYTTFTFGVGSAESSGKSKPTRTHRQLGRAGAFRLCSPPSPSQSSQGSNSQGRLQVKQYVKLHSDSSKADYPSASDQTSLLWTDSFSRLQTTWSEKNQKKNQPLVHRQGGRKQISETPPIWSRAKLLPERFPLQLPQNSSILQP